MLDQRGSEITTIPQHVVDQRTNISFASVPSYGIKISLDRHSVTSSGRNTVKLLKYVNDPHTHNASELEHRVRQLTLLAKALAGEVESLQVELATNRNRDKLLEFDNQGIDFYKEVERYEIDLIKSALNHCNGNQTKAARLLRLKSTTLNAKMKHYGLNPVRSITLQRVSQT